VTGKEKLDMVCKKFSALSGEKQDHILGILEALVFARNKNKAIPHSHKQASVVIRRKA
jgi:hypothetical protein